MVVCLYFIKEGIELNILRKIIYLRIFIYEFLFVYLLRKVRGSLCSCVYL